MSQIALFMQDGDIRDWRPRISRPERGRAMRALCGVCWAQLLPSTRLLHQPARRGRSASAVSEELDTITTGSGGGTPGAATVTADSLATAPLAATGAGSRTVERRRDGAGSFG